MNENMLTMHTPTDILLTTVSSSLHGAVHDGQHRSRFARNFGTLSLPRHKSGPVAGPDRVVFIVGIGGPSPFFSET
jgi:hypothetical protein